MLLSILWSFPCISSRLSWGVETSFFLYSDLKTLHGHFGAASYDIHPISDFLTEGSSGQSPPLPAAACPYPSRRQ